MFWPLYCLHCHLGIITNSILLSSTFQRARLELGHSSPTQTPTQIPVPDQGGTSHPIALLDAHMEVSGDSEDKAVVEEVEGNHAHIVSFDDVMDAADFAVDALESSALSRVSDTRKQIRPRFLVSGARRRACNFLLMQARNCPVRCMSPESSSTEYTTSLEISETVDGPMMLDTCDCACSTIQGPQQPVFIHLSLGSDDDIEID